MYPPGWLICLTHVLACTHNQAHFGAVSSVSAVAVVAEEAAFALAEPVAAAVVADLVSSPSHPFASSVEKSKVMPT